MALLVALLAFLGVIAGGLFLELIQLPISNRVKKLKVQYRWTIYAVLAGIIFLSLYITLSSTPDSGQTVQEIAQRAFRLQLEGLRNQNHKVIFSDLDGDGTEEGVVGYENTSPDSGIIRAFSSDGRILWEVNTFKKYDVGSGAQRPNTAIVTMVAEDVDGDKIPEIVAAANDPFWFLSRIVVLDSKSGKITRDYVHAGRQDVIKVWKRPTRRLLLLKGNNNDYPAPAGQLWWNVALLDPTSLEGQGPPGTVYDIGTGQRISVPYQSHLWYFLATPPNSAITDVSFEDGDRDGELDAAISHQCGYTFYLDLLGKVRAIGLHTRTECGDPVERGVGLLRISLIEPYQARCFIPVRARNRPETPPWASRPIPDC